MINHEGKIFMNDFGFSTGLIYTKGERGARYIISDGGRRNSHLMRRDDEKLRLLIQEGW